MSSLALCAAPSLIAFTSLRRGSSCRTKHAVTRVAPPSTSFMTDSSWSSSSKALRLQRLCLSEGGLPWALPPSCFCPNTSLTTALRSSSSSRCSSSSSTSSSSSSSSRREWRRHAFGPHDHHSSPVPRQFSGEDGEVQRQQQQQQEQQQQQGQQEGRERDVGEHKHVHMRVRLASSLALGAVAACLFFGQVQSASAADALKTCACLLDNCRGELLRCLGDVKCAANIACLQSCNGRPDETECQIGCGDLFENSVVDQFNACAVSEKQCVPQKADEKLYPIPPDSALVPQFNVQDLQGDWFISAGQNPTFDTFDCQLHTFKPTGENSFQAKLTWRIRTPDGGFFTRTAIQDFVQPPELPAVLLNHDNEFLHYQDDWYILSSKMKGAADDYFLVYYRGKNDAWDGYGGAVLYTRSRTVPPSIVAEVREACRKVGLDFDRFVVTDNSCPPPEPLFARLEKVVEKEVEEVESAVLEAGRTELQLLSSLGKGLEELQRDKDLFLAELGKEERELLQRMEAARMGAADDLEDLFGNALPLRRIR